MLQIPPATKYKLEILVDKSPILSMKIFYTECVLYFSHEIEAYR